MEIHLKRFDKREGYTKGLLYIEDEFQCFTIEDQERKVKIKHKTCIPEGRFEITLRDFGGFDGRYKEKFPEMHKGMLWLRDVPNFEYILIHIGNYTKNTSGCILVGKRTESTKQSIERSKQAYIEFYKKVIKAFERNEKVYITITSI